MVLERSINNRRLNSVKGGGGGAKRERERW